MLTGRTLRLWARDQGVDLASVGLLGLVTLPYAYKFIWAPLMDRFTPPWLGRRRGWLVIIQVLLMAAIAGMAFTGPVAGGTNLKSFAILALIVAFLSASQDIVSDAYRTDVLHSAELGRGASVFTSGYRLAMLATGAGAVALATILPWQSVYLIAAGAVSIGTLSVMLAPNPTASAHPPESFAAAVVDPVRDFFHRNGRHAWVIAIFIFAFKLPDYMAAAMTDAMLLDLGFSKQAISIWSLGVGTAVTIPGALIGGMIVTKFGLHRSLIVFGLAQALSNGGYLILASVGQPIQSVMIIAVGVEYFCMGLVAAGFIAFLMSQCNQRYSATQYALLSSLMGLCNSVAGAPSGFLVQWFGYSWYFVITILAAAPGMALLPWLLPRARLRVQCARCGEEMREGVESLCPECGTPVMSRAA